MLRTRFRVLARLCLFGILISFHAAAQSDGVSFHIAARPIAEGLVDLALQAKLSIGYSTIDFQGAIGNPVEGYFKPDQAVKIFLAGSGYEPVVVNSDTILIRQVALVPAVAQPLEPIMPPAIEEIIVTTTKRSEVAQLLPLSIVVVPGGKLNDLGVQYANDLQMHVSALSATNLGPGQDKLSIRGLSDSTFTGRSQSIVGLYLDESRLTDDAPDPDLRLVDIDRIEIVRGPQGTLYGAGSLGGLVRIITNKPVLNAEQGMVAVSAASTEHGAPSSGIDAMLNVPIVDNVLGVRVVGYIKQDGGYIDDVRLGLHDINKTDIQGIRLSALWAPSDDWSVTLAVTVQAIDTADSQYIQAGLGALNRANFEREPRRDQFLQSSLTVEGGLDWANVTSTTAFTKRRLTEQLDATSGWAGLTGFRTGPSTFDTARRIQSITHETRLTSVEDEDWSWITGVFLSHRDEDYHSVLAGPDNNRLSFIARAETRDDNADEAALFGEVTYKPIDWLSVTAGTRLYYSSLDAAAVVGRPNTSNLSASAQGRNKATGFIPKLIVSIHPEENLTFYVDASEGFRLGGININSPIGAINVNRRSRTPVSTNAGTFDSDRLWTYEVGAKMTFFDRALMVNTGASYTVWDNIQSDQILRDGSLFTSNAGGVHVPGFENDLDLQVTRHFHLEGNFFWNDPEIVHANPLLIQSLGRLPGVPKSSFGIAGRYDLPLNDEWVTFASLDYSYTGQSTLGFDARHSPTMGDYSLMNLRLGLTHDRWQATLFINNLADTQANSFAYGNPFSLATVAQITPLRPRTVGMNLSASY